MRVYKLKTPPITQTHPFIASQWHPTENDRTAASVTQGSRYRAWWFGSCGHKWQSRVLDRTHHESQNLACPQCYSLIYGPNNHNWKGHGEISAHYWSIVQNDARRRGYEFDISIEYAWNLFLKQNKECALTRYPLCMLTRPERTASLDRIDNTQGYIEGNVQWVHKEINRMKWNQTQESFKKYCYAVAQNDGWSRNEIASSK